MEKGGLDMGRENNYEKPRLRKLLQLNLKLTLGIPESKGQSEKNSSKV